MFFKRLEPTEALINKKDSRFYIGFAVPFSIRNIFTHVKTVRSRISVGKGLIWKLAGLLGCIHCLLTSTSRCRHFTDSAGIYGVGKAAVINQPLLY